MKLIATIKDVNTGKIIAQEELEGKGEIEKNFSMLYDWSNDNGYPIKRRLGSSLSATAGKGILVEMSRK